MNISNVFNTSGLKYDRYLYDDIALPFKYEDICIQPNETVSSISLNQKIDYLFDNFLYLYRNTLICSNLLPVDLTNKIGVTGNNVNYFKNLNSSQFVPLSSDSNLSGLDNSNLVFLIKNLDTSVYYTFLGISSKLIVLKLSDNSITKVLTLSEIDPTYGIEYKNISSIAQIENFIFLIDSSRNQLVKYDATGFIFNNNILKEKLVYVDSIGNFGGKTSKLEFNSPTGLTTYKNNLYVLDSGNSCVKIFDKDLNWIKTYRLSVDLLNQTSIDIASDKAGNIYILSNKFLFKYSNDFKILDKLDTNSFTEEKPLKIIMSPSEDNIFYILTEKNVYKKFTTNLKPLIGKYLFYRFGYNQSNEKNTGLGVYNEQGNDKVIIFSKTGNTGKLGIFLDNLNLYDILAQRDFDIYDRNQIYLNGEEYFQNWCINKSIAKLIVNHMRFRDQIIGKYIAKTDILNNIVFSNTRYLLPTELDSIFFQQDLTAFLGVNEVVSSGTINRCLRFLFNIQYNIANILKTEIIGTPYYNNPIALS